MATLETIILRADKETVSNVTPGVKALLDKLLEKERSRLEAARLFVRGDCGSDLVVTLLWNGAVSSRQGSDAGIKLAVALKNFGAIAQILWQEWP